jgi:hypothetical protein
VAHAGLKDVTERSRERQFVMRTIAIRLISDKDTKRHEVNEYHDRSDHDLERRALRDLTEWTRESFPIFACDS